MKRPFSSLPAVFGWIAVLAVLALAGPAQAAPAGEAAASRVTRAVRRVHVHRVWSASGMESDPHSGMSIYAHVEAVGLKWWSLLVEVRLCTPDGKPVRVAAGAPKEYADDKGRFYMSTHLPVFEDPFEWEALRASIPHEKVLDLPAERPQRLIATFRVSSDGLSSVSESEITIPPGKPPGVTRAVRVLALDPFPNRLRPESEGKPAESPEKTDPEDRPNTKPPLPSGERVGVRGNRPFKPRSDSPADPKSPEKTDRDAPASTDRGLAVEAYVEAVGLDGRTMTGRLSFRREDGKPLVATDSKPGVEKPLVDVRRSAVVSDQAQIFLHFVDYRSLNLEPGPHRLILSYSAHCDGLKATMEEEHALERLMIDD